MDEHKAELDRFHIPDDAGEYADGLVAIMMRIPDGWGRWISCDRGWYPIIIDTDQRLAELDPVYVVHQVKEKFGGLRYYYQQSGMVSDDVERQMDEVVQEAEARAAKTCERCGTEIHVELRQDLFRILTLCEVCEGMKKERR